MAAITVAYACALGDPSTIGIKACDAKKGDDAAMRSVFVVEVHACFRESLACVLDREPDLQVIGQASSLADEHALRMATEVADTVILGSGGISARDELAEMVCKIYEESSPPVAVLVLTTSSDPAWHAQLLEAGAERVLNKNASLQAVVAAVLALGFEPLAQPGLL